LLGDHLTLFEVIFVTLDQHNHIFCAQIRIKDAKSHHTPRVHAGDIVRQTLQVLGVDVLATHDYQVFLPPGDKQLAACQVTQIAAQVPAVQECFFGQVRPPEVTIQHAITMDSDLANVALGQITPFGI
jgi:hypothetical protein